MRGPSSIPGQGTKILQAAGLSQKKKNVKDYFSSIPPAKESNKPGERGGIKIVKAEDVKTNIGLNYLQTKIIS